MSKWTMFWIGAILSATVSFVTFRGGDMYNRFSPDGYQTFQIAIPNSLLTTAMVSPHDIKALTRTFHEATMFATAHAVQMKDSANLKKLDMLLGLFIQHDEKRYEEWLKKHKLFF